MTLNPIDMKNKSQIAKLLATEDITVQHSHTQKTASFDVKHRVLTLPTLDFADDDVYDLFVGHEVAHALFTPPNFVDDLPEQNTKAFHSIFNIVEDNRIERAIQSKYRGLAGSFNKGYKTLFEENFFGVSEDEVNDLGVLDRFNIATKASSGMYPIDIEFTPEEQVLLDEIKSTETWEDVVNVSKKIFEFVSNNTDSQPEQSMSSEFSPEFSPSDVEQTDEDDDPTNGSSPSNDMEQSSDDDTSSQEVNPTNGLGDDDDESDDESDDEDSDSMVSNGMNNPEFDVTTQESLDNAFTNQNEESVWMPTKANRGKYVPIDKVSFELSDIILTHEQKWDIITEQFSDAFSMREWFDSAVAHYTTWQKTHAKKINHMVKEFELKKSAEQHKRTMTHTTGVLDMKSLFKVPYSEDVFLSQTVTPDGQSHGFVAYIDWSGSMYRHMGATIDQLMMIAGFCRKANIPFHAYAFTEKRFGRDRHVFNIAVDHHRFTLMELFTTNVSSKVWMEQVAFMTTIREYYQYGGFYSNIKMHGFPFSPFSLTNTPLNASLVIAPELIQRFQKQTGVDKVNFVVLTDGMDNTGLHTSDDGQIVTFKGGKTTWDTDDTFELYDRIKSVTGATVTVFHISKDMELDMYTKRFDHKKGLYHNRRKDFPRGSEQWNSLKRQFTSDGYMTYTNNGFDLALVIHPKSMESEQSKTTSSDDLTAIKREFRKTATHGKKVKKMLSTFIETIA